MPTVQKICAACGEDVAGKKRIKDPGGHYFCEPCYAKGQKNAPQAVGAGVTAAAAPAGHRPPPLPKGPPPKAASSDDDLLDLAPIKDHAPADEPKAACSGCKKVMAQRQVRNVDGEFLCNACISKRSAPQGNRPAPAKTKPKKGEEEEPKEHSERFSDSLQGGALISAVMLVVTFATFTGLFAAMPERGESGLSYAMLRGGAYYSVLMVFQTIGLLLSMVVAGKLLGGISFGFIGAATYKSMIFYLLYNVANFFMARSEALDMLGWGFRYAFILGAFIVLFRIDFFEAMLLAAVNFILNIGLFIMVGILFVAIMVGVGMRSGSDDDDRLPGKQEVDPKDDEEDEGPDDGQPLTLRGPTFAPYLLSSIPTEVFHGRKS